MIYHYACHRKQTGSRMSDSRPVGRLSNLTGPSGTHCGRSANGLSAIATRQRRKQRLQNIRHIPSAVPRRSPPSDTAPTRGNDSFVDPRPLPAAGDAHWPPTTVGLLRVAAAPLASDPCRPPLQQLCNALRLTGYFFPPCYLEIAVIRRSESIASTNNPVDWFNQSRCGFRHVSAFSR